MLTDKVQVDEDLGVMIVHVLKVAPLTVFQMLNKQLNKEGFCILIDSLERSDDEH